MTGRDPSNRLRTDGIPSNNGRQLLLHVCKFQSECGVFRPNVQHVIAGGRVESEVRLQLSHYFLCRIRNGNFPTRSSIDDSDPAVTGIGGVVVELSLTPHLDKDRSHARFIKG